MSPVPRSGLGLAAGCWVVASLAFGARQLSAGAAEAAADSRAGDTICLAWDPGSGADCPTADDVAAATRAILGRSIVSEGACKTMVAGSIRPQPDGGWRADVHFASRTGAPLGDRSLEVRDGACSALKDPLSLVIALMVDGGAVESRAFNLSRTAWPRSAAARPAHMTSLSIGGAASSGLLPDMGFGAAMGLASRAAGGLPLKLEATVWFPTARATSRPGGQFWALLGGVDFCPSLFRTARFGGSACVGVVAGAIRGVGLALAEIETATRPFSAGELSAALTARLSRQASVYFSLGIEVPWLLARFVYRDPDDTAVLVYQPGAVIPMASLGIQFDSNETGPGATKP